MAVKKAAITKMHGLFKGFYRLQTTRGNVIEDCSGHEWVNTIYNGTMDSDPARRLAVDMHVERLRDLTSQHHLEFLPALAQALSKRVGSHPLPGNKVLELCSYLPVSREVTMLLF